MNVKVYFNKRLVTLDFETYVIIWYEFEVGI